MKEHVKDDYLSVGYKRKRDELKALNPLIEAERLSKKRQLVYKKLEKIRLEYDEISGASYEFHEQLEVKCDAFRARIDKELVPLIVNAYDRFDLLCILNVD